MSGKVEAALKTAEAVREFVEGLEGLDKFNFDATVRMFSVAEMQRMVDGSENPNQIAFLNAAIFVKSVTGKQK